MSKLYIGKHRKHLKVFTELRSVEILRQLRADMNALPWCKAFFDYVWDMDKRTMQ